ncbi:transcriptional regulator [Brevibacillus choshinensis]|uniref:Transcriptional regulator n=1 Tax=Brevibacillus choshinensis TaxID=54911 RepID=A0ABR5NA64_BRECH|nr:TetR/AcrR family transcriptional regulator [Brevibacillus choshinensis]KQL48402.1 transcriptional regulator [Brevibacillus choshinensis]
MSDKKKASEKQSFIAEARRNQIVEATIATLDEIGYINASLAQIAKRAGISTALISYHFKDKNDLMDYTLVRLITDVASYVWNRIQEVSTSSEKLRAYIEASIAYQGNRPTYNTALIEIVFHARTPDNVPYYKLSDDEDEPLSSELKQILLEGQANGEFCTFNVMVMASAIRGAIDEYLFNGKLKEDVALDSYSSELVNLFDRAVRTDG